MCREVVTHDFMHVVNSWSMVILYMCVIDQLAHAHVYFTDEDEIICMFFDHTFGMVICMVQVVYES